MGVLQQSWTDFCGRHRRSLHRKMAVSIKENAISHCVWDVILNKWEARVYYWRRWKQLQLTLPKCMNQNSVIFCLESGNPNLSLIFGHLPKISNNGLYQLFYRCRVYYLGTDWASWKDLIHSGDRFITGLVWSVISDKWKASYVLEKSYSPLAY